MPRFGAIFLGQGRARGMELGLTVGATLRLRLWLGLLWVGGCSDAVVTDPEPLRSVEQAIVNGEVSQAFAATGALIIDGRASSSLCTGTLVAEDLVLSAAHCFEGIDLARGDEAHFLIASDLAQPVVQRRLSSVAVHPDFILNDDGTENDIAVGRLSDAITNVVPVGVSMAPARELIGETVTLVGYGANVASPSRLGADYAGAGVRRSTEVVVRAVSGTLWGYAFDDTASGACVGDSGGPAFIRSGGRFLQVGVTSIGDSLCREAGFYTALDATREFLLAQGVPQGEGSSACQADGVCNGGCERDSDCAQVLCPPGTCRPAANGCEPVGVMLDDDSMCAYVSATGEVCATTRLVEVSFDEAANLCIFSDPLGRACAASEARCTLFGCGC